MPIYEFDCRTCDREFEELVPFDASAVACPDCGSTDTGRRLSTFQRVRVKAAAGAPASAPRSGHGGCCGGSCGH